VGLSVRVMVEENLEGHTPYAPGKETVEGVAVPVPPEMLI